jgi:hypothetical protein
MTDILEDNVKKDERINLAKLDSIMKARFDTLRRVK